MRPKRYYARKRLDRATCGHKSFEKQDSRSTDIFDTKMDLNLTTQNFFRLKLDILTKRPVSDLSISENRSRAFFVVRGFDKKDFWVI